MKRFLAMLMTMVLLCGCFAMAEEKTFDYKVLEGLDGYSYDKFEKTWSYSTTCHVTKSGRYLRVALTVSGDQKSVSAVTLAAATAMNNASSLDKIDKIIILADDTSISVGLLLMEELDGAGIKFLMPAHAEALRLIAEAQEISFKVYLKDGSSRVFEPTKDETAGLIQAAKVIYEKDLLTISELAHYEEAMQLLEKSCPLIITE